MCGRSRRPSEGSRRSQVWTCPTPTSALKARGSRTFPALEPHPAAPRSVPRHHQQGHGEPRGRPSPLLQARSQGRLVGRLRSTRQVELWGTTISESSQIVLASRAAMLAFGDELIHLRLPDEFNSRWFSPRGRDLAAAYQLPRAEAALRQELQRLADAVRRAREGQSSSSSGSRALCPKGLLPTESE